MNERIGTHLTPEEAQEIHKGFMGTFTLYVVIALVAHALLWAYKPGSNTGLKMRGPQGCGQRPI